MKGEGEVKRRVKGEGEGLGAVLRRPPRSASPGPNMTQKEVLTRQIISKPIAQHEVTSQAPLSSSFAPSGMSTWIMPL